MKWRWGILSCSDLEEGGHEHGPWTQIRRAITWLCLVSCQGPQVISVTPPATEEGRAVGGDAEGINTHAVPLEDPINEKDNGKIAQSDLDTWNDYSLRTCGPATRDYRLLNA